MDTDKTDKNLFICVNLWFNFFEMKTSKLSAILICLTSLSASVFACTLQVGSNVLEENKSSVKTFIIISIICWFSTGLLYVFSNLKNRIPLLICSAVLGFYLFSINTNSGDCGFSAVYNTKIGASINFVCALAQFTIWLMFRKKSQAELS